MRTDIILFILGILSLAAQLIIGVNINNQTTTTFSLLSLALLIMSFSGYWLVSSHNTKKITDELSRRLPSVATFMGIDQISRELVRIVEDSKDYVYATGSATRDANLLSKIEDKVEIGGVSYIRLLFKRHMRPQLLEHLTKLQGLSSVKIGILPEDHFGYYIITPNEAFMVVPNVIPSSMIGLHFTDEERVAIFRQAFEQLSADATPIRDPRDLLSLYETLKNFGE